MAKALSDLIAIVRQKSNTENNQFVSDPEITIYINEGIRALYDLAIGVDESYYNTTQDFTLTSSAAGAVHALPADFYKVRGLSQFPDTSRERSVFVRNFTDRNRPGELSYILTGNNLIVRPWARAGEGPWRLVYVPKAPQLVAPTDTLDVTLDNFDEYPSIFGAIRVVEKREMDSGPLTARLGAIQQRVNAMAADRQGEPEQAPVLWTGGRRRRWAREDW
jgi:hypothetical protein